MILQYINWISPLLGSIILYILYYIGNHMYENRKEVVLLKKASFLLAIIGIGLILIGLAIIFLRHISENYALQSANTFSILFQIAFPLFLALLAFSVFLAGLYIIIKHRK